VRAIEETDALLLSHMRPYALADEWGADRRDVLRLFLLATRFGMLDFRWDLLCPMCRGARASVPSLSGVQQQVHCEMCNIDFTANFERSVELTFPRIPRLDWSKTVEYCIGGPTMTPHVVVQQLSRAR